MHKDVVLFSPIGSSDPIRGNFDGPMLHIVRHYRPRKVYLFLTEEMNRRDEADDRYAQCIQRISPETQVVKLRHCEIQEAHNFLIFDQPYKAELHQIHQENPDSIILANLSSGTPQMQSTLYLLSATLLEFPLTLVAVETFRQGANNAKVVPFDNYDVESELENLLDNLADEQVKNRTKIVQPENVQLLFSIGLIRENIGNYNYAGAMSVFRPIAGFYPEALGELLQGAVYRQALDNKKALMLFRKHCANVNELFSVQSSDRIDLYEYILYLQERRDNGFLMDFTRALSPCIVALYLDILKRLYSFDTSRYCDIRKGIPFLCRNKLPTDVVAYLDQRFNNKFEDRALSTSVLNYLIEYFCHQNNEKEMSRMCSELRTFEEAIRNPLAHTIRSISEAEMKKVTGFDTSHIMQRIQKLYGKVYKNVGSWNAYGQMNEELLERLQHYTTGWTQN